MSLDVGTMGFFGKLFKRSSKAASHVNAEAGNPTTKHANAKHNATVLAEVAQPQKVIQSGSDASNETLPEPSAVNGPANINASTTAIAGSINSNATTQTGNLPRVRSGSISSAKNSTPPRRGSTSSTRAAVTAAAHGMTVVSVKTDDSSFFRALAHQLYGSETLHLSVRQKCVDFMRKNAACYNVGFANPDEFATIVDQLRYGASVASAGIQGRAALLAALADMYGVEISLLVLSSSDDDDGIRRYKPGAAAEMCAAHTGTIALPNSTNRNENTDTTHRENTSDTALLKGPCSCQRISSTPSAHATTDDSAVGMATTTEFTGNSALDSESSTPGTPAPISPTTPTTAQPPSLTTPATLAASLNKPVRKERGGGHRRTASVPSTFMATAIFLLVDESTGFFSSLQPAAKNMKSTFRSTSSLANGASRGASRRPSNTSVGSQQMLQTQSTTQVHFDYAVTFHD